MTAEDMFKELGYTQIKNNTFGITYIQYKEIFNYKLDFFKHAQQYACCVLSKSIDRVKYPMDITPDLHKAITKQMEELGWL